MKMGQLNMTTEPSSSSKCCMSLDLKENGAAMFNRC